MKTWISSWKGSVQPRKQRKYRYKAPKHARGKLLSAHLSKELRQKYNCRSIRVRKGDKVKVVRGEFRGKEGKIERVDLKKSRVYLTQIEVAKKDGSKVKLPIPASNLIILELEANDKLRIKKQD